MKIHIGRGSVVVEWPHESLMKGLSLFRHTEDGSGRYDELYTYSDTRHTLVTLPGFAERVKRLCDGEGYRITDERIPMPEPDIQAARAGIDEVWHRPMLKALEAGGGVVAVPDILGAAGVAATILRAYPRDRLIDRGTPVSLIAVRDNDEASRMVRRLRALVPERELGKGWRTDCEDVIVATYADLSKMMRRGYIGIFIGDVFPDFTDRPERIEGVSSIRNAARWGVMSSPFGGCREVDLAVEGMFGPLAASMTYKDAVDAGVGVPVTVCWLPCPRPDAPLVSASESMLESIAHGSSPQFVRMVSEIVSGTPDSLGCLLYGRPDLVKAIPGDVVRIHKQIRYGIRNDVLDHIASGGIRKALLAYGYVPERCAQGVVVSTACGGADAVRWFPWRRPDEIKKVYVVDFSHTWDVHNGRPGRLARNDEARMRRYGEMGFSQIQVEDVDHLPFIG